MAIKTRFRSPVIGAQTLRERRPPLSEAGQRLLQHPLLLFGATILLILALIALFAPILAPYDPDAVNPANALQPPGATHWLGTDDLGRDVFSRLVVATRVSILVGLGTALTAVLLGAPAGALAGYYGGVVDSTISRLIDIALALPTLPLALVLGAFVEVTPLRLVLMLGAVSWMGVARLVRGEFLVLRRAQFTEAASSLGIPTWRIIFIHLLPNAVAPISVAATLLVANAILIESALSFLGFGIQPPAATWGNMLYNAQRYIRRAIWLAIAPGALITLTVTSINFVGDGLREALDPRLKGNS